MKQTFDTTLFRTNTDSVNKDINVVYRFIFEDSGDYTTIREKRNGNGIVFNPSFALIINDNSRGRNIYLPGNRYYAFITLLEKSIKLIRENLYTIFPNIGKIEFEIDSRVLERFQTEQAIFSGGIKMVPAVWSNSTDECFPGIMIMYKESSVILPLEDTLPLMEMLRHFDPMTYALTSLRFFGKME